MKLFQMRLCIIFLYLTNFQVISLNRNGALKVFEIAIWVKLKYKFPTIMIAKS